MYPSGDGRLAWGRGAARERAHTAWRLVMIDVDPRQATFRFSLERNKLRHAWPAALSPAPNLVDDDPARLWNYYLQLVRIEGLLDIGHFNGTAEPSRLEIGAEIPELERHVGLACGTFSAISGDTPAARRLRRKPYLRRRRQTQ